MESPSEKEKATNQGTEERMTTLKPKPAKEQDCTFGSIKFPLEHSDLFGSIAKSILHR